MHCRISVVIATFSPQLGLLLTLKLCLLFLFLHDMLFLLFSTNHGILVLIFITAGRTFTHYCISAVISIWTYDHIIARSCDFQMLGMDAVGWFLFCLSSIEISLSCRTCRSSFWAWNRIDYSVMDIIKAYARQS